MTNESILQFISEAYGDQIDETTPIQEIVKDSLDILEFAMMLERKYGVNWTSLGLTPDQTVGAVVSKIIGSCDKQF